MDNYFLSIVESLSLEEIEILNMLTCKESTSKYSAQVKREVFKNSKLSEANFRKIVNRLEAMNYIEVASGSKEHLLYVTEYGQMAIQTIFERSNS